MEPSTGHDTGDRLDRIVARAHREGHGYVVLAVGVEAANGAMHVAELAHDALAAETSVLDAAFARAETDDGEAMLLAAVVAPGTEILELGAAVQDGVTSGTPIGVATSVGRTALTLDVAIAVALAGLEIARNSGAWAPVHTELYELVQATMNGAAPARCEVEVTASIAALPQPAEPAPPEADDPFARVGTDEEVDSAPSESNPSESNGAAEVDEPSRRDDSELLDEIRGLLRDHEQTKEKDRHARALLERRIAKLVAALDAAQGEIARLRRGGDVETGVASIYQSVQGLDDGETHVELKRALVEEIFRKNALEQQRFREREGSRVT
ncbi:MAG: hypothetical protein AAF726_14700 [Planctomycetota bacterium]